MIGSFSAIFYLAIFGLICGMIAVIGGAGAFVWFMIEHVQIV
ncbi:hypothetical protein O9X99_16675 [Agrobacterium salinitolerans]|nr:hypothetical protein [Agrobacterium salinitolerans]MCZ7893307.1 hypothetical protein [Agrobacterium salinitolerans]